jgi:hypothetical protein
MTCFLVPAIVAVAFAFAIVCFLSLPENRPRQPLDIFLKNQEAAQQSIRALLGEEREWQARKRASLGL